MRRTVFDTLGVAFGNMSRMEDAVLHDKLSPHLTSPSTWKMLDATVAVHFEVGRGTVAGLSAAAWGLPLLLLDPDQATRQKEAHGKVLYHKPTNVRARVQEVYRTSTAFKNVFCALYGYVDVRRLLC